REQSLSSVWATSRSLHRRSGKNVGEKDRLRAPPSKLRADKNAWRWLRCSSVETGGQHFVAFTRTQSNVPRLAGSKAGCSPCSQMDSLSPTKVLNGGFRPSTS